MYYIGFQFFSKVIAQEKHKINEFISCFHSYQSTRNPFQWPSFSYMCSFTFFPMVKKEPNKMGCKQKQGKCTRHTKGKIKKKYDLPVAKHIPKPNPTTKPIKQRLVFLIELQKHVNKALILGQSTSITPPIKRSVFFFPITHKKIKIKLTIMQPFWSNLLLSN